MSTQPDLVKYQEFVCSVVSDPSLDFDLFISRLKELHEQVCSIQTLDTAFTGMASESGEALDIVKKIKFQSKPWNEDTKTHLIKELGDIGFYWALACFSLGMNPYQIASINQEKLEARYPKGFDAHISENKPKSDI